MSVFHSLGHRTSDLDLEALATLAKDLNVELQFAALQCIEVGSWVGLTALVLAPEFKTVWCVDHWQGTPSDRMGDLAHTASLVHGHDAVFRTFCDNVGDNLLKKIFPCRGKSLEWAVVWPHKVHFIFLDADHEYESVQADILAWRRHIYPGGILCGHDYSSQFPGVVRAVDELIPATELKLAGECLWWTRI